MNDVVHPPVSAIEPIQHDVNIEFVILIDTVGNENIPADSDYISEIPRMSMQIYANDEPLIGNLFVIRNDMCNRYVPSRMWFDYQRDALVMMYYTSSLLTYRQFLQPDERLCVFLTKFDPTVKYKYDARAKVLIDQVLIDNNIHCVFLFGSNDYDLIVSPKM